MCQKYCILTWNMAFEILDNVFVGSASFHNFKKLIFGQKMEQGSLFCIIYEVNKTDIVYAAVVFSLAQNWNTCVILTNGSSLCCFDGMLLYCCN